MRKYWESGESESHQRDFNEQSLVWKGRLKKHVWRARQPESTERRRGEKMLIKTNSGL